jgi:hypothetical protein
MEISSVHVVLLVAVSLERVPYELNEEGVERSVQL